MNLDKRIGENAQNVRRRLGMSQAEFAELLRQRAVSGGRKWNQKTVSALENGTMPNGTWKDLWDLAEATGLAEAWWVSHEVDLRDLVADNALYRGSYEPYDDLHPVNAEVRDGHWFHRDDTMHLPNPSWWEGLQAETLPLRISA